MTKLIATIGLPGSGKSRWADEQVARGNGRVKKIEKDMLRQMLDNAAWSRKNEGFIIKARDALITQALKDGYDVISSDTNLAPYHLRRLEELAILAGAAFSVKDFRHVPLDECIKRDLQREKSVGERVIREQYRTYIAPSVTKRQFDPSLPPAVICDLDGTLALLNGRNPYDASTCEADLLNEPLARVLMALWYGVEPNLYDGHELAIFLFSGRSDEHRPQTVRWLRTHKIEYCQLCMRPAGDTRRDSLVKREMFEQYIEGKYNVLAVFDDRLQVCEETWIPLGLPLFYVGDFTRF